MASESESSHIHKEDVDAFQPVLREAAHLQKRSLVQDLDWTPKGQGHVLSGADQACFKPSGASFHTFVHKTRLCPSNTVLEKPSLATVLFSL